MMNEEKVIECIAKFAIDDQISAEDKLVDLGIDSLGTVEMLIALEDMFHIEFDISSLNPNYLITVKNVIDLVSDHLAIGE